MALVEIMRLWSEGVAAADKGDWSGALKSFTSITEPRAKICFNIGCCHLIMGDLQGAEKAFTNTVERDNHLAIGYFQRGSVFFKEGKYSQALHDWDRCFSELRGNQLIDYKILGLTFKLYSCEILYNVALGHAKVGNWGKAEENLILALSQKAEPRHGTKIEKAMQEILKQKDFPPTEMPKGRLFHPNEKLVEQLEKKDYLGKATVVASVVDKDNFSGFAPLQPQADNSPKQQKAPETLRTLQGEPHRVLFEFTPETGEEMGVMPGNIVFVLKKGDDNWATVLFNGKKFHEIHPCVFLGYYQKGIVPCNYLAPLELKFQSQTQTAEAKQVETTTNAKRPDQDITSPPKTIAPGVPNNKQDKPETSSTRGKSQASTEASVKSKHTVTYPNLLSTLRPVPKLPENIILNVDEQEMEPVAHGDDYVSFRDGDKDVLLNSDNVEKAWSNITDNCLKLKCTELDTMPVQSLPQAEERESRGASEDKSGATVTALFDYEASQPEDLAFKKGDTIKVLNKVSEEWWEGECHEKLGIFPSAFVE